MEAESERSDDRTKGTSSSEANNSLPARVRTAAHEPCELCEIGEENQTKGRRLRLRETQIYDEQGGQRGSRASGYKSDLRQNTRDDYSVATRHCSVASSCHSSLFECRVTSCEAFLCILWRRKAAH